MNKAQKYLFTVSTLTLAIFSIYGFYLIRGNPKIEALAASGHAHLLLFAYGAILFGVLLRWISASALVQNILAVLMSLTFIGPLDLIYAGVTGQRSLLAITTPLFNGLFAVLWFIMAFYLAGSKTTKSK